MTEINRKDIKSKAWEMVVRREVKYMKELYAITIITIIMSFLLPNSAYLTNSIAFISQIFIALLVYTSFKGITLNEVDTASVLVDLSVASLLSTVFVTIAAVFLIVPGIILSLSYGMSSYLIMQGISYGSVESLKDSRHLMNGYKKDLFLMNLSLLPIMILGSITIVFIPFVVAYVQYAGYLFFEEVLTREGYSSENHNN